MKKLIIILISLSSQVFAQISEVGIPYSLDAKPISEIPIIEFPEINLEEVKIQDSLDALRNLPMRFGISHLSEISSKNHGVWFENKEKQSIWQLKIKCPEAFSVNLIYKTFDIPSNGKFYVYNEDKSYILGAFTSKNQHDNGGFSTGLIPGETIILEYNGESEQVPVIEISNVIHGYKDFFNFEKNFGDSGPCNNNVNCPEGLEWSNQANSVAMIVLSSGNRWCSGAMINNTCEDGTPYFLTANHCLTSTGVSNWLFYFNYQSPNCTNINGPTNEIVSGARLVSTLVESDFALLELNSRPPVSYNTFYSGWSKLNLSTDTAVSIHHPSGDIKKISFSYQTTQSTQYISNTMDTSKAYWRIPDWDDGTTEGGSSGSPLFNSDKQIIGQLRGGFASCNNNLSDWYGKLSYSWDNNVSSTARLKDFLDPSSLNYDTISGSYFNVIPSLEAGLSAIASPESRSCLFIQEPEVLVKNLGLDTITSVVIAWEINGLVADTVNWTGIISPNRSKLISILPITFNPGSYTFNAQILFVNGQSDFNSCNNVKSKNFEIINGSEIEFQIRADSWPEETSVQVADTLGNILYEIDNLQGNRLDSFFFCLAPGCYDISIFDSYGDGIISPGFYNILYNDSSLFMGSGNFGNCTGSPMPLGCFVTHRICPGVSNVSQSPNALFTILDSVLAIGDTVYLIDQSQNFPNIWTWNINSIDTNVNFNVRDTFFIPTKTGKYDVSLRVENNFGSDSLLKINAFRVTPVGLSEELNTILSVFPNPAKSEISIVLKSEYRGFRGRILNLQGQEFQSFETSTNQAQLNIESLSEGIYIIEVLAKDQSIRKKIIVQ